MSSVMRALVLAAGALASLEAGAQEELRVAAGVAHNTNFESTYGWQLDYAQGLGDYAYATVGWLNEGHQVNEHRDGLIGQLWGRTSFFDQQLSLAFGIGPYAYFDTERDGPHPTTSPYTNEHGLAPAYSAELTWYMDQSWLAYLRANHVEAEGELTTVVLLGVGYRFDGRSAAAPDPSPAAASSAEAPLDNELTLYLGRSTLNSFAVEGSSAYALEYRRSLSPHVDWSIGWLDEGSNNIIHRNGVPTELWLVQPLLGDRLTLGIGGGVYFLANQDDEVADSDSGDPRELTIISLMASYRFDPHWSARCSFNRVITHDDRDADTLLFGMGYRF